MDTTTDKRLEEESELAERNMESLMESGQPIDSGWRLLQHISDLDHLGVPEEARNVLKDNIFPVLIIPEHGGHILDRTYIEFAIGVHLHNKPMHWNLIWHKQHLLDIGEDPPNIDDLPYPFMLFRFPNGFHYPWPIEDFLRMTQSIQSAYDQTLEAFNNWKQQQAEKEQNADPNGTINEEDQTSAPECK